MVGMPITNQRCAPAAAGDGSDGGGGGGGAWVLNRPVPQPCAGAGCLLLASFRHCCSSSITSCFSAAHLAACFSSAPSNTGSRLTSACARVCGARSTSVLADVRFDDITSCSKAVVSASNAFKCCVCSPTDLCARPARDPSVLRCASNKSRCSSNHAPTIMPTIVSNSPGLRRHGSAPCRRPVDPEEVAISLQFVVML